MGKKSKVVGTLGKGTKKRNIGELGEWKKEMEEKNKKGKCKKTKQQKKSNDILNTFIGITSCGFIYESCQSESMKCYKNYTH